MTLSVVSICNIALSRVAVARQITSLDEQSEEARLCSLHYEPARDTTLRDHPWPFARRRVALALVAEDPEADWAFSYRYPTDCERALFIPLSGRTDAGAEFIVGQDATGRLIYTDQEDADLVFTRRESNPGLFPSDFSDALAWRLASEIALPLSRLQALADRCLARYRQTLSAATATGLNESGPPAAAREASSVRARE